MALIGLGIDLCTHLCAESVASRVMLVEEKDFPRSTLL